MPRAAKVFLVELYQSSQARRSWPKSCPGEDAEGAEGVEVDGEVGVVEGGDQALDDLVVGVLAQRVGGFARTSTSVSLVSSMVSMRAGMATGLWRRLEGAGGFLANEAVLVLEALEEDGDVLGMSVIADGPGGGGADGGSWSLMLSRYSSM